MAKILAGLVREKTADHNHIIPMTLEISPTYIFVILSP